MSLKDFLEKAPYWIGEVEEVRTWLDEAIAQVLKGGWEPFLYQVERDEDLNQRMSALCCDTDFRYLHLLEKPYQVFLQELFRRWARECLRRGGEGFYCLESIEQAKANNGLV